MNETGSDLSGMLDADDKAVAALSRHLDGRTKDLERANDEIRRLTEENGRLRTTIDDLRSQLAGP